MTPEGIKVGRPQAPRPCAPDSYLEAMSILLEACRETIKARGWDMEVVSRWRGLQGIKPERDA